MTLNLENLQKEARAELEKVAHRVDLEDWWRANLGRKGKIQRLTRRFGELEPRERSAFGQQINEIKTGLKAAFEAKTAEVERNELEARISAASIDVTLPGRRSSQGGLHPSTRIMRQMYRIFGDMGFQIYRSPEVVTDQQNFEWLNMPPHHPARDMQDTFYTTEEGILLRTHTSPGQISAMLEYHPEPVRVIVPGMCYRSEQITARSEIQFNQIEGLAVGHGITLGDLKGTLTEFAKRLFGDDRKTRFRASYFPFTEPSAEMDVSCFQCNAEGCQLCKYSGWLEILGCGMVHPAVLRNGGYDPDEYSGFAFGSGPERIAMMKYGITDIRSFWNNDLRFLEQF